MNDDDFFREQFADVTPLKKTGKVTLEKSTVRNDGNLELLRKNAVNESGEDTSPEYPEVSDDYVEWIGPTDILGFKRPGIQDQVFKKLRLGKYPVEGRLDLHRKKVVDAKKEVAQFIRQGMGYSLRTLLIVHGKGERNRDQQATLKSYVAKWLKENPSVMAFHSAAVKHGGVGAVYVMLRKSEKAKEAAREKHGGRA